MKQDKLEVDPSDLEKRDDGITYYQGKPCTGFWDTGELRGEYKDGKRHGVWEDRTCRQWTFESYKDGKLDGKSEEYFPKIKEGKVSWYLALSLTYKDGEFVLKKKL